MRNDSGDLDRTLGTASEREYFLKLYVTGSSFRSATAVKNITSLCEEHLSGRYTLQIIDVLQQPELAHQMQLLAAPTLIKERPEPQRRIVGDLSNEAKVLHVLDVESRA